MSTDSSESQDPGLLTRAYRTVTPGYRSRPDTEMHAVGLAYVAILLILLVPLLPFVLIIWAVTKLLSYLASLPGSEEE
ncbi:hypothetical protein ACFO0N_08785 [Halobium salinum]|uniref:Uncharacterized protein n=1 Tax=Halobium salinum TaxID=1364940 RepID=A0ABD5PAY0_9EURY|nr:hypothetical protein [Halobium salinum]